MVCVVWCVLSFVFVFVAWGKSSLLGDTFKQVLADMEGEYGMSFLTERSRLAAPAAFVVLC